MNNNSNDSSIDPKLNFFLISSLQCQIFNSRSYCVYSTFLILISHVLFCIAFALTVYRMNQLVERFRNQYNLSLIWLLSIVLIFSIDILEFIVVGDPYIYSKLTIGLICASACLLITICLRHLELNRFSDPQFYRNIITIAFVGALFILIVISRMWSNRNMNKLSNIDKQSKKVYRALNLHQVLYYLVLLMFASVQIYENVKFNIFRCFTNSTYVFWLCGAFLQTFYASILPMSPKYDFIFYRTYLLSSTILVILMQDAVVELERVKQKMLNRNANLSSISMKEFRMGNNGEPMMAKNDFRFVENAFQNPKTINLEEAAEEDVFDRRTYKNVYLNQNGNRMAAEVVVVPQQMSVLNDSYVPVVMDNGPVDPRVYRNKLNMIYLFILILIALMLIAIFCLLSRVRFNFMTYQMFMIHPVTLLVSVFLKRYGYI